MTNAEIRWLTACFGMVTLCGIILITIIQHLLG